MPSAGRPPSDHVRQPRGIAASSGTTPSTIAEMALDAIEFIEAPSLGEVDLLGFSIGSFVAQEIALGPPGERTQDSCSPPRLLRARAACTVGRPTLIVAVGKPETPRPRSTSGCSSPARTRATWRDKRWSAGLFGARTADRDAADPGWQTRLGAVRRRVHVGVQPNHSLLERVSAIDRPVFVAQGDSDPMILPGATRTCWLA